MKQTFRGGEQINGKHGMIWWDGDPILEIEAFESKIVPQREEVSWAMKMGKGSKITGLVGEGSMTLKKVYSRGYKRYVEAWKKGLDPISTISSTIQDPQSPDGQKERVTIGAMWLNELPITSFEDSTNMTTELPFGFDPDEVDIQETIDW